VHSAGATVIGPQTAKGTLVLIGGRRALVSADGAVEAEKVPTHEPLDQLVAVPVGGATVIVGRGEHEIVRFDDPLGAPLPIARSEATIARIGAGPGVVAVWTSGGQPPRFLDVQTGQEKPLAGLPEPPLTALTFVDAKRGAGLFELAGLAVTADGGATWRTVAARAREAFGVKGMRVRGDALRAYLYEDGPDALVEVDQAKLGTFEPSTAPQQPLLRWIHATSRDPLEAVAMSGVELPGGAALVGSHGMLARVDVKTGAISELHAIAQGRYSTCYVARAATMAWVACGLPEDDDHFDPFGVMRVPLAEGKIAPDKPSLVRNTEAELRVSPSGGALLMGACNPEEGDGVCVRQPDGKWHTFTDVPGMDTRGAGALADGRVVFLRGISEDDAAPEEETNTTPPDEAQAPLKRLHLATLAPDGKEKPLAVVPYPSSADASAASYVRAQSHIEEDNDHSLHMVLAGEDSAFVVSLPAGRDTATLQRIPDAAEARIHGGRGVAVGNEKAQVSLDSGATWSDLAVPPDAADTLRMIANAGDSDSLRVSEMGLKIGPFLRLGWGAPEPSPAAPELGAMPSLARPHTPPAGPELGLTCTGAGTGTGLPVLQGSSEARLLLGFKPKPNDKRAVSTWASHMDGHDPVALLEEEATDKRDAPPPGWTFRWHDPREIGAKAHSANVKPPAEARKGSDLRLASADGGRALFAVRSGGKQHLVRIKPAGGAEIAVVPNELAPNQQVVFGIDKGEPIAWVRDNVVVVWLLGEKPRAIAELGNLSRGTRVLGTPTASGVPLLASADEWALLRTLPIPAMAKGEAKPPPPAAPALDGWTRVPPLRRALGTLPACTAKTKGARFLVDRSSLRTEIDGLAANGSSVHYGVRLTGAEACVDAVYATLAKSRSTPKPVTPAKTAPGAKPAKPPAKAAPTGATWVRADLVGNKAEGGERGAPPAGDTRRMKCALTKP
jgi:hypothetical protein